MEIKNIRKTEINLSNEDKDAIVKVCKIIQEIKRTLIYLEDNKDRKNYILLTDDYYFDLTDLEITNDLVSSLAFSSTVKISNKEDT